MMTKIFRRNFEKSFLKWAKNGIKKDFPVLPPRELSNHSFFLVQFEINLHLWVFQKAEIALTKAARAIVQWKVNEKFNRFSYGLLVCRHIVSSWRKY